MSKSVTYVGDYPEVVVWVTDDEFVVMHQGDTYDVPDGDRLDALIEQGAVIVAAHGGGGAPPHSATKDEWSAFRAAQGHDVEGLTKAELIDLPDTPANEE